MIDRIEHHGIFISDVHIPGETRADGSVPAHTNGIQLSENRFLLLISTLAFRGLDDTRSIIYQLRADSFTGPVIREGMLAQSIDDWDPLGDGGRYVRQYGHPVAFGVPKGAVIRGRTPPHANLFVIKYRIVARTLIRDGGYLLWYSEPVALTAATQDVHWLQCRLNDTDDDIEILEPAAPLRQKGFEGGPQICEHPAAAMNTSFVQAVPLNADADQWGDMAHFEAGQMLQTEGGSIAALRYAYDRDTHRYQWVQTGPLIGPGLFEASLVPYRGDYLIAARQRAGVGVAWARTADPFASAPPVMTIPADVRSSRAPIAAYACPDGAVRLLTGERDRSPYGLGRNPLYLFDIDPDAQFACTRRQTVLDTFAARIKITRDHGPIVDMAKILPHIGGSTQTLIHRVRSVAMAVPQPDYHPDTRILTADDFQATAVYSATLHYEEPHPPAWRFPVPACTR